MVQDLLSAKGSSISNLCQLIERCDNENELRVGFDCLNEIMWTLSMIAPLNVQKGIIFDVLQEMKFSDKFDIYLNSAVTPHEAIKEYKTVVVQDLALRIHKRENFNRHNKAFEDELFCTYFPRSFS